MLAVSPDALERSLSAADDLIEAQVAAGLPLGDILESLLLTAEIASGGGMVTSVLLVAPEGGRLLHGAAPNLPGSYCAAIDGIAIGPNVGSCGTAAHLGEPVYVDDIATDLRWTDFRDLALEHGLRACWSTPIHSEAGDLMGTFAVYNHTPRAPSVEEIGAIGLVSRSVALAIARRRA